MEKLYDKNTPEVNGQISFEERMAGMDQKKKAEFLCWRLGDMTGRQLTLQSWWPGMEDWESLDESTRKWAVKQLTAELDALELLEKAREGRARYALTMRDKLLLYMEALHRIMDRPDEMLDAPCTWAKWRAVMAQEVQNG